MTDPIPPAAAPNPSAGVQTPSESSYLAHLPGVFAEPTEPGAPSTVGRLLLAFEHVLSGLGDVELPGVEELVDGVVDPLTGVRQLGGIARYVNPGPAADPGDHAPTVEFLDWLAGWVALGLRAELDEARRREFIARAVSLYALRGTAKGLREVIRIYTRLAPTIDERTETFQIGTSSRIGVDTVIGGSAPHFFRVQAWLPTAAAVERRRQLRVLHEIIDAEKPAHTHYELDLRSPRLQLGRQSRLEVDTLLTRRAR
jgi:phage tail-like protein